MSNIVTLIQERGKTHGDFGRTAVLIQQLKDFARQQPEWESKSFRERECIDCAAIKLGRMISGNTLFPDHMADIDGYARLASS